LLMETMLVLAYVAYTGGFLWQKLTYRATAGLQSGLDSFDGPSRPRFPTRL
jgi:hypothetical protein